MASNREERLQMRQRGAGTRQIKAVDFGFAFGLPAAAPQESSRQSPQPSPSLRDTGVPSRRSATPNKQQTPPLRSQRGTPTGSLDRQGRRRSSRISRNDLPERPSTFDIPSDDVPEQGRSAKRRRISTFEDVPQNVQLGSDTAQTEQNNSPPAPDTVANTDTTQLDNEVNSASIGEDPRHSYHPSQDLEDITSTSKQDGEEQIEEEPQKEDDENETSAHYGEPTQPENVPELSNQSPKRKRKKRKSIAQRPTNHRRSLESVAEPNNMDVERQELVEPVEPPQNLPDGPIEAVEEQENSSPQQEKRIRGRPPAAAKSTRSKGKKPVVEKVRSPKQSSSRPKKPRKSTGQVEKQRKLPAAAPDQEVDEQSEAEPAETEEEPEKEHEEREDDNQESPQQPLAKKDKKRKPVGRPPTRNRRPTETVPEEPEASSSREQRESHEAEPVEERPPPKPRRGRPSGSKTDLHKAKQQKERSSRQEAEETEPAAKETKSRGETVPVTIHRLANVAALDALPDSAESPDEAESADELSTRKKFSGRSGVNPADVLSQICRETLDKTLTTLNNGISNESNPARRAEWTRKRKAVEAFGAELEGRLFDMSEMLDSNFMLSMQLKKTKRRMTDMRSRLLQVRREREEIALRMDEVRRRHTEDESAMMARNAVNNSFHSLELAIDRNRSRSDELEDNATDSASTMTAGLEFLLRTVAEDVSSTAPGSQGGLLNQIKAFNAQLERTAKSLENLA